MKLQHIVSSCKSYLHHGRYNWRHDSVLLCLSKSFSYFPEWSIYADLPSFLTPSLISGDTLRPDLILHNKHKNILYILELTVDFESNLKVHSDRKLNKYKSLVLSLSSSYNAVHFVNVSMSAIGVLDNSCHSLVKMMKDLDMSETLQRHIISKIMNKDWSDPDLMDF